MGAKARPSFTGTGPLMSALDVYGAFARTSFLKMLAYRLRYVTGIFTYFVFVSVHYFIWSAVFSGGRERINGFTLTEMITYIAVGWISRTMYFSNVDEEMNNLVETGEVSLYVIRPVSLQVALFFQALGESAFRLMFFTLPVAVAVMSVYSVSLPASLLHACLFLWSTFIAFLVLAEINFIVGLLAFYFNSINGIMRAKYLLIQLLSGLLLPIPFFPDWFRWFVEFLPVKFISYVPLQFYLGKVQGDEILSTMIAQTSWVIGLFILGHLGWKKALDKLTYQGG